MVDYRGNAPSVRNDARLPVDEGGAAALPNVVKDLIEGLQERNPDWGAEEISDELLSRHGRAVPDAVVRAFFPADHPCRQGVQA